VIYRRLGKSGLKVSAVSLGGWITFGEQIDAAGVREVVAAAVDSGVNYVDLADVYARGAAEETFATALEALPRHQMVVASKAFWPMSDDPNDRGLSRKHLFASIDGSLRRLRTDYLDLYFCHRHDDQVEIDEVVMAMDDLVRQGKVLYWGTSVWPASRIEEAVQAARRLGAHQPRAEQPRYNLLDRHIEPEIVPTAERNGMGLVVWSPLAQGVLTGKYAGGIPADSRAAKNAWMRRNLQENEIAAAARLAPIAAELGITLGQLALAWCLRLPQVSSVITGASRPGQVIENAAAVDVVLDDAVLDTLEEILGNRPPAPGV
jgi:voltage-dependent potassium channel beta subunit